MEKHGNSGSLRSGELAALTGVSTDTLRHYERVGVLSRPARTASGYRQYPAEAVDRVRLVRRAMGIGFSLQDLALVLRVRDHGGAPCRQVHALALQKLAELDQRIAEMSEFRSYLGDVVRQWHDRLQQTPEGQRARLLETLVAPPPRKERS